MLKDLLYNLFKTLCPRVFTTNAERLQQAIPSGQESGTYIAPANGVVKLVGHCVQIELYNQSTGESYSFSNANNTIMYKAVSVFVKKGDEITWQLSEQQGRNTNLYFFYSEFDVP